MGVSHSRSPMSSHWTKFLIRLTTSSPGSMNRMAIPGSADISVDKGIVLTTSPWMVITPPRPLGV